MRKTLLLVSALFAITYASAQDDGTIQDSTTTEDVYTDEYEDPDEYEEEDVDAFFIDHKVTMGEKIIMISKKYMVDPKDIYKYNEEAINGIDKDMILKIPLHKSHKRDLDGFKAQLEKERGGPIQVPAPPRKKRKPYTGY